MSVKNYFSLDALMALIEQPNRDACHRLLQDNRRLFESAPGSSHNHQAWPGGYLDHVTETMNIALALYRTMVSRRPLPFSLADALLVLFLHDIEKPWKYAATEGPMTDFPLVSNIKRHRHEFRLNKLAEYGISLTAEQTNAMRYVEGEHADYSARHRVMGPLAAFCHICDVASARLWHDCPLAENDRWPGAERHGR